MGATGRRRATAPVRSIRCMVDLLEMVDPPFGVSGVDPERH